MNRLNIIVLFFLLIFFNNCSAQSLDKNSFFKKNYSKKEVRITMRDGIKLFTSIYSPKDKNEKHPIIIWRTPYSCYPYGESNFPSRRLNSFYHFVKEGYIIVFQDVRGRFMSEGQYVNMRPYIPNKSSSTQIDETTDTYDTVDWLVNNVDNNNGNVGLWGISYPGFYAAMASIDAHPAVKAVSPQAPIADWFIDDDMHHNGAFSLLLYFNFFDVFGLPHDGQTKKWPKGLDYPSPDAYTFFKNLGPLKSINENYFKHNIPFHDSTINHPNYDYFWQKRNTLPHFKNIKPAVLVVGGWFDGEDLYGALQTYQSIEDKNKINNNHLVMGPWVHGGWTRTDGSKLGDMDFGFNTSQYYINNIELPFFNHFLKGEELENFPEAFIFNTVDNKFHKFNQYPPKNIKHSKLFLKDNQSLGFTPDLSDQQEYDEYLSDPFKPVPYTSKILDSQRFYNKEYMVEDQRFASSRPDVLVYETNPLEEDVTLIGGINATLFVSTTSTDADWVVKIIDVFPDDEMNPKPNPKGIEMGGYQMLVRGEIMRGKYRNSYEHPKPFVPNKVTKVTIRLNDICHTFKKEHKIMIQIQSSWFPLFDSNPQTFTNIYKADESDFKKAFHRVYHTKNYPSNISFNILK